MKSVILSLLCICTSIVSFGQIKYESGYIIDNQNDKSEVFIKNIDWNNNPTEFKYKTTANSNVVLIGDITTIKEFGIDDYLKYERFTVDIDQSSSRDSKLSTISGPDYLTQTVYLKQLVNGDADLYNYHDNDKNRYFFRVEDGAIKPLVYKRYKLSNQRVGTNSTYKKQILDALKCNSITLDQTRNLDYTSDDLIKLFVDYNTCSGAIDTKVYEIPKKKADFDFTVKVGYFNSSLDIKLDASGAGSDDRQSADMGSQSSFRFAGEVEYMFAPKSNKWSVFLEAGFQSYESSTTIMNDGVIEENRIQDIAIDYKYIDFVVGLRHHMYISDNSKLYMNAGFAIVADMSDKIDYSENPGIIDLDINSASNIVFGIGYVFKNKVSIEGRFNTVRDITNDYIQVKSSYNSVGVILGYKLF